MLNGDIDFVLLICCSVQKTGFHCSSEWMLKYSKYWMWYPQHDQPNCLLTLERLGHKHTHMQRILALWVTELNSWQSGGGWTWTNTHTHTHTHSHTLNYLHTYTEAHIYVRMRVQENTHTHFIDGSCFKSHICRYVQPFGFVITQHVHTHTHTHTHTALSIWAVNVTCLVFIHRETFRNKTQDSNL